MMDPVVCIYGGSTTERNEADYETAVQLGRLLAENGYSVMTGGYAGIMEAASRGAKEAGGHVIGVTTSLFDAEGRRPNLFLDDVIQMETLTNRLIYLVTKSDAAIAMPGGIGTLSEIALTWSLMQVGQIPLKPFLLMGEHWADLMQTFYGDGRHINQRDMHLFQVIRTPEQAISLLQDWE
ncbi:MAG: TIGR00730 family Rossman fold protein [Anaerolineae bacterium]|nr:TIGR00730 family Rossman fold protein [Anaerolineae bacterium]